MGSDLDAISIFENPSNIFNAPRKGLRRGPIMRLADKVAIITGGGRGIGRAIALTYAREGARLALVARTVSELDETARQAEVLGAETLVIPGDISDQSQVDEMLSKTLERFSTIDILVNNAGVLGPIGPLQDTEFSEFTRTFQVNVFGTFLCCRAVLPVMLEKNQGKIINVTSGAPFTDAAPIRWPISGWCYEVAYLSSKAAMDSLTELLSYQVVDKNIEVNAMIPIGPSKMSEEASRHQLGVEIGCLPLDPQYPVTDDPTERSANLSLFLASDASDGLSGRLFMVFDDFTNLANRIPEIMSSDAYTLRRVEI